MRKLNCELNQAFGYWTVIDNVPIIKGGHTYIKVRCKCGKEEEKCLSDLTSGRSTGCKSCKAQERSRVSVDIGDKFKEWTVLDIRRNSRNALEYFCECSCGNRRWFEKAELINPNRSFACHSCAGKTRKEAVTLRNGRVGELTLTRYNKLKKSAIKRGYSFEVSIDFLWNLFLNQRHICAITGDYIKSLSKASLDRIDSSKGYTEDNVQWVTYQANVSKHTMSMDSLYEFCRKVLNHANQQPSQPLTKLEGSETNN